MTNDGISQEEILSAVSPPEISHSEILLSEVLLSEAPPSEISPSEISHSEPSTSEVSAYNLYPLLKMWNRPLRSNNEGCLPLLNPTTTSRTTLIPIRARETGGDAGKNLQKHR